MLGEQKVTLALERDADGERLTGARDGTLGPVFFFYHDWLHLDLRNTSEEILWLHSVEVLISVDDAISTIFLFLEGEIVAKVLFSFSQT